MPFGKQAEKSLRLEGVRKKPRHGGEIPMRGWPCLGGSACSLAALRALCPSQVWGPGSPPTCLWTEPKGRPAVLIKAPDTFFPVVCNHLARLGCFTERTTKGYQGAAWELAARVTGAPSPPNLGFRIFKTQAASAGPTLSSPAPAGLFLSACNIRDGGQGARLRSLLLSVGPKQLSLALHLSHQFGKM